MKIIKKIIACSLVFFSLFIGCIPLSAEEEVPRVIFENTENSEPDLFISKHVESADERYPAPSNVAFQFSLKIDNELANNMKYQVFNADGSEEFRYADGNKVPFATDRSGNFTLKDGQTAKFSYIGTGKHYEAAEYPQEGFQQIQPAGMTTASGTISAKGAAVHFINLYIPPDGEQKTTRLRIQKNVAFPIGYEAPETPDFTFTLKLKKKPYTNEEFTIFNTKTGMSIGGGTTNERGEFTLKGGQEAVFEEIPVDVDYEVTESQLPDWHVVGETVNEGATRAPVTLISITNANAAFGVTKKMQDNTKPETPFTFVLTDQNQKALAEMKYYLYSTKGNLADTNEHVTDINGKFELMPGQAAIFYGIEPGTVYNVHEEAHENFIQRLPNSVDGYTNKTVNDAVEILPFVNEQKDIQKELSVTKKVEVTGTMGPAKNKEFTFVLTKKDKEEYVPVTDAVYRIAAGGSEWTHKTDKDGLFYLKKNETASFRTLKAGEEYRVEEINLPAGYTNEDRLRDGVLEKTLYFTFVNQYQKEELKLYLHKQNKDKIPLPGAKFILYKDKELTQIAADPKPSGEDGEIVIEGLAEGTYYLKEIQAPAGYQLLSRPIIVEVYDDGSIDELHLTIENNRGFDVPMAGGDGVMIFFLTALAGMCLLTIGLYQYKEKGSK